ncbi:mucin-like glycoprotein, partial [Trypanosoma cruzi]
VNVSVEISCADSENKLQWRFPGQTNWTRCVSSLGAYDYTVVASSGGYEDTAVVSSGGYDTVVQEITEYSVGTPSDIIEVVLLDSASGASSRDEESLCLSADRMYLTKKCNASCKSAGEGKTAFTMEFQTTNESGVYKKSLKNKTENNAPAGSTSGICPLNLLLKRHLRASTVELQRPLQRRRQHKCQQWGRPQRGRMQAVRVQLRVGPHHRHRLLSRGYPQRAHNPATLRSRQQAKGLAERMHPERRKHP